MEERRIFICDCHSLEHQVCFWYDPEEKSLYIEPHLVNHDTFVKRLWVGIRYAFGYRCRYGEFDEMVMCPDDQKKLVEIINKHINE